MQEAAIATKARAPIEPLFPELEPQESDAPATQPGPLFRFIDLFAGIGGIRLGLESVRGECVHTVEFDKWAMRTYNANHGVVGDDGEIAEEPPVDIFSVDAEALGEYEVLAAGFPCQPFSIAGVSKNLALGRQHGFGHEKSGNLFLQIVRLIDDAPRRPAVLFLENVKHLRHHDGGRTFAVIMATLDSRGYEMSSAIIDAKPWVPQHRERTYMIGLDRDVYGGQVFAFPGAEALPPRPWPTMDRVLERGVVDQRYTLSDHLWQYLQDYAAKHRAAGNGFGYGLVDRESVSRTLSARYHKDGSEILVRQKGRNPRRLTPRECARLMGFPPNFQIPSGVSDTQLYRQFGNSVVVPVIEHLARQLVQQAILPVPVDRVLRSQPDRLLLEAPSTT